MIEPSIRKKNNKQIVHQFLIGILLFVLVVIDLWYFVLWPKYGLYPFRDLRTSDILSATAISGVIEEAELTDDEIELLVGELKKIKIYPPRGEYEEPEGGRFIQFKVVFKNWFWEEIYLADYGKYFLFDWVPSYRGEDSAQLEHGVAELFWELINH